MHVDIKVRNAMGLAYDPAPSVVMAAIIRDAKLPHPTFSVVPRIEEWFVLIANGLSSWAPDEDPREDERIPRLGALEELAEMLAGKLHVCLAPSVLAILAPNATIPSWSARELPSRAKSRVKVVLPAVCAAVLARWADGELATGGSSAA